MVNKLITYNYLVKLLMHHDSATEELHMHHVNVNSSFFVEIFSVFYHFERQKVLDVFF